ncbi:MAG: cobyrinate a,c-diamide synthase, partial [Lachnospiraceae bacterium]|nr:cobyrinate a,c-diamide synthase [Lachnospiraceae bacterium]
MKRLMISAPGSGMGKTVLTGALIRCFMKRGLTVAPFKCGPDYIDPVFHSLIAGVPCRNLDLFMQGRDGVLRTFNRADADIKVIEGVMGFYDGVGGGVEASSFEVADVTDTPVILAADPKKIKGDVTEALKSIISYRKPSRVRGFLFTGCDAGTYESLFRRTEDETGLKVYGYLPGTAEAEFGSRHLGLVGAREITDLKERFDRMAELLSEHADIEGLMEAASGCAPLPSAAGTPEGSIRRACRIAVAYDEAFSFYYEDNLDALREAGAELLFFSPMKDDLPEADGLYIGGGYPELHLKALSE